MITGIKKLIFLSFFVISLFFVFGQNDVFACEVVPSDTGFRPAGIIPYSDDNRPFVYYDVKTSGCENEQYIFHVKLIDNNGNELIEIANFLVRYAPPGPTESYGFTQLRNSDYPDFTIPIHLGEKYMQTCGSYSGKPQRCMISGSVEKYIPESNNFQNIHTDQFVGLRYDCDGFCTTGWVTACNDPVTNTWSNILVHGGTCPLDPGFIEGVIIFPPGMDQGQTGGGYSEAALAPLPGMSTTPDVGGFLKSFFTIIIVIAGILALIMIVVGGVTYITSDAFSKKNDGKTYIANALTGLILALGAWIILNTINPNLASNLGIYLPTVSISIGDADYWGPNAQVTSDGVNTGFTPLPDIGLYCPGSGGVGAVPQIIDSFVGKTTYRWGGKGGPLPDGQNFTLSPNEQSSGSPHMCQGPNGQVPCHSFCPADSVCLDCSGFANQVRRCAGLQTFGGTASMVGYSEAKPVSMNTLSSDGQSLVVEGQNHDLVPGDLLVWNGHVVVYYGDGIIAESSGALTTNTNIKKTSLASYSGKNKITHIIRVQ